MDECDDESERSDDSEGLFGESGLVDWILATRDPLARARDVSASRDIVRARARAICLSRGWFGRGRGRVRSLV